MIVINFKNYVHGRNSLDLARKIERYLPEAIVCVSALDISLVSFVRGVKVYAQHIDSVEGERATGFISAEGVRAAGAVGSLLNHSEHRLTKKEIKRTMKFSKKHGLKIILCVESVKEAKKYLRLKPYAMALEDKALIGSGKSITSYRQGEVKKFAEVLKSSGVLSLCGAGVNSVDDVKSAYALGCKGVLIASAVARTKNPEKFLKDFGKI